MSRTRANPDIQDNWPTTATPTTTTPSTSTTPTRASRTKGFNNETHYPNFTRSSPSTTLTTTFSIGDPVIIGPSLTPSAKWLQPPPSRSKSKSKKSNWSHEDGLRAKEKVGIIVGLWEDAAGLKMAKVRWFARPGAVWGGISPEEEDAEDVEPYELYYTADSKFLEDTRNINWTPGSTPRSTLSTLKSPFCTDTISISHITSRATILPPSSFSRPPSRSAIPTFVVKKVYDVNPVRGAEFFGEIEWEEVFNKGMSYGEWDTEEIRLPEEEEQEEEGKEKGKEKEVRVGRKVKKGKKVKISSENVEGEEASSSDEETEEVGSDTNDVLPTTPSKKRQRTSSSRTPTKKKPATPRRVVPKATGAALLRAKVKTKNLSKFKSRQRVSSSIPLPFTISPAFLKLSQFERAKALLHVSATPETLPCRDDQRANISALLGEAILDQSGTCLYIHGVPGTGKTATVHSVMRDLQQDEEMESFQFVEINGMKISEPNTAFTVLWEAISGQKSPPRQALTHLENHFQTPDPTRKTVVVLVDELDQMITKKQDVIYNFFNWPHVAHSRLIVIAIANTMDLPERELSGKIRSRLGSNRIPFPTYSWTELESILEARLQGLKIFQHPSLQRIAKSVALVSGDARRALDVARRTVEKKDQSNQEKGVTELCTMADVAETYKEMTNYGSTAFVKQASLHHKIFLLALSQCIKRAGVPEVELESVIHWHLDFLRQTALEPVPSHSDLFDIAADLHGLRLIATESQRGDYFQKVRAMIANDDLFEVLKLEDQLKRHVPKLV